MITLHMIKPKAGAVQLRRKRVGRGNASGHGTYSGRGMKGQNQRAGGRRRPGFEGGQTPLIRRLPKLRGFSNPNKVVFQVVNVAALNGFKDGDDVTFATLLSKGLVRKKEAPVKVLGMGHLKRKLTVKVQKVSREARKKIVEAGGKVV